MAAIQPRVLDSVLEDQEPGALKSDTSNQNAGAPLNAAQPAAPGRRLSFSRRHSFGLSSIPALAAAQAAQATLNQSADTIHSVSLSRGDTSQGTAGSNPGLTANLSLPAIGSRRSSKVEESDTLKPNLPGITGVVDVPSRSFVGRKGAINMDELNEDNASQKGSRKPTEHAIVPIKEADEDPKAKQKKWKKFNPPSSTRLTIIHKHQLTTKASVWSYNPYPYYWPDEERDKAKKKGKDEWARMVPRFKDKELKNVLGPGTYEPSYKYVQPRNVLDVGGVAFKSGVSRFRKPFKASESNPDVGPGVYSVEVQKLHHGFVPWVKTIQSTLSRVIDFKDPIERLNHIQLLAEAADLSRVPLFSEGRKQDTDQNPKQAPEPEQKTEAIKPHHPLHIDYLMKPNLSSSK